MTSTTTALSPIEVLLSEALEDEFAITDFWALKNMLSSTHARMYAHIVTQTHLGYVNRVCDRCDYTNHIYLYIPSRLCSKEAEHAMIGWIASICAPKYMAIDKSAVTTSASGDEVSIFVPRPELLDSYRSCVVHITSNPQRVTFTKHPFLLDKTFYDGHTIHSEAVVPPGLSAKEREEDDSPPRPVFLCGLPTLSEPMSLLDWTVQWAHMIELAQVSDGTDETCYNINAPLIWEFRELDVYCLLCKMQDYLIPTTFSTPESIHADNEQIVELLAVLSHVMPEWKITFDYLPVTHDQALVLDSKTKTMKMPRYRVYLLVRNISSQIISSTCIRIYLGPLCDFSPTNPTNSSRSSSSCGNRSNTDHRCI